MSEPCAVLRVDVDGIVQERRVSSENEERFWDGGLVGRHYGTLCAGDGGRRRIAAAMAEAERSGVAVVDVALVRSSAEPFPAEWFVTAHRSGGEIIGYTVLVRDVTDQEHAAATVRDMSLRLELAQRAARVGAWDYDLTTGTVTWSGAVWEIYGREPSGIAPSAESWIARIHSDDRERILRDLEAAHARPGEDEYVNEYRFVRADGDVVWLATRALILRDGDGTPVRMIGVDIDITDRKRAEAALAESEQRFRLVADAAPVLIWQANTEKLCTYFNRGWLEFTGRSLEHEVDFGWAEGIHPDDLDRCIEVFTTSIDRREAFEMDYRLRHHSGEYRWLFDRGVPIYDSTGTFTGFIGACVDITERLVAEREREVVLEREQVARREVEEASRLKDEFLATVSHELRTPLNSILGWATMLRTRSLDETMSRRGLDTIERNARSQVQLIEDLLDISRIITGKMRLNVQPVDVGAIVNAAVDSVRPAAEAKRIRLESVVGAYSGTILGDPERLQQVVWNLLNNAVKFTSKGGKVQVHVERIESHVEITVADTGVGIAPEFLPFAFDRFRQADMATTRMHGGLGLGLSIVRNLVELHGGSVTAESEGEGHGATFTVMLPLTLVRRQVTDPARIHTASRGELDFDCPPALDGLRVLVVDDEPDTRDLLEMLLKECDAEPRTAGSAAQALEAIREWKPELLVSDVGMPDEDGFSLIRKVRESERKGDYLPALALTAYARAEDRVRLLGAGFDAHLPKPVDPAELLATIASLARRFR